jgi:hypothetical protein
VISTVAVRTWIGVEVRADLIDSWSHIDQGAIDWLIASMPRRINAVRTARGFFLNIR